MARRAGGREERSCAGCGNNGCLKREKTGVENVKTLCEGETQTLYEEWLHCVHHLLILFSAQHLPELRGSHSWSHRLPCPARRPCQYWSQSALEMEWS